MVFPAVTLNPNARRFSGGHRLSGAVFYRQHTNKQELRMIQDSGSTGRFLDSGLESGL
jgi:hypothetical protein